MRDWNRKVYTKMIGGCGQGVWSVKRERYTRTQVNTENGVVGKANKDLGRP